MNIEKICSQYADLATVTDVLNNSHPEFTRGVFDMCAAFNLKVDAASTTTRDDVWLLTESGWVAGRLLRQYEYSNDGEKRYYYKYVSRAIKKAKGDSRADRNARAATKIKDLIKVIRMKKEMLTDEKAMTFESPAIKYAYDSVTTELKKHSKPKITLDHDVAESVFRTLLDGAPLPEAWRVEMERAKAQFDKDKDAYEEATASMRLFEKTCYAVGMFNHWSGQTHYFVSKVEIVTNTTKERLSVTVHGPVKRYTTLVGTPLEADAAIIRTYMQSKPNYEAGNELGLPRRDNYYNDVEVATGYSGDTMTWALLPARV